MFGKPAPEMQPKRDAWASASPFVKLADHEENLVVNSWEWIKELRKDLDCWASLYQSLRVLGYDPAEDHAPSWHKEVEIG